MIYTYFIIFFLSFQTYCFTFTLSTEDAKKIGMQIWINECAGKKEGLTSWNVGEEFASIGIGHFIWFPKNVISKFEEQFPKLLTFFEEKNIKLPQWLENDKFCPWNSRTDFQNAMHSEKLEGLRTFLIDTLDTQVLFIIDNLEKSVSKMMKVTPDAFKKRISSQIELLKSTPNGLYALIDYRNFKGDGSSGEENYSGFSWGLLQVLEQMPFPCKKEKCLEEFINSAKMVLTRRVKNAPIERDEKRWLKGWINRLDTYNKKL